MKVLDAILTLILLGLLGTAVYFFFYYAPIGAPVSYQEFKAKASPTMLANLSSESKQFYQNLRYEDKNIRYYIDPNCDQNRRSSAERAFAILQNKTILTFYETPGNPEIVVTCSNIAPTAEEKDHFIAGEGGPSKIIVAGTFSVILFGKISLYREDKCEEPQVAVHEILHALGFDHNTNQNSILYPITDCNQRIDQSILDYINQLYSIPSLPDLSIDSVNANRTNNYLNFEITISNIGLRDSKNSSLSIYSGDNHVESYVLDDLDVGRKKVLSVQNLFLKGKGQLKFVIETNENEITKSNNEADINIG